MTPVETLEAAILKLETQRDALQDRELKTLIYFFAGSPSPFDSLVLTLHSTITPLLDYLRDDAKRMKVEQNQDGIPLHYRHQLALADAILKAVNS